MENKNCRILVCDDDEAIVEAVSIYLKTEGYQVEKAYDGMEALEILKDKEIHLLIIDVMMPRMDGVRAVMKLRESNNLPVIVLSAKSEDADKILGLRIGADDYVTKPFHPLELMARVASQLRRYTMLGTQMPPKEHVLVNGGLVLDDEKKQVTVDGKEVRLTPSEYRILKLLMENMERVYSSGEIYERVWEEDSYGSDNIVAVHIRHIREKIEINPKEPRYLKVVWGQGYKMSKC
jgi:DNA-binding response OmpR family regulator